MIITITNSGTTPTALIKEGGAIYYKAISPTDLNSLLIISLGHF